MRIAAVNDSAGPDNQGEEPAPRRTAVGTVRTMVGMGYVTLIGVVLGIFVPRALQPEGYALFTVVSSVVTGVSMIGLLLLTSGVAPWLVAPLLAPLFGDASLTSLFRLFAIAPPLYISSMALLEVALARRQYERRVLIIAAYWTFRAAATIALLIAGFAVPGVILGAICGSLIAGAVGFALTGVGMPRYTTPLKPLLTFQWPLGVAQILYVLFRSVDIWLVKALIPEAAAAGYYGIAVMIGMRLMPMIASVNWSMAPKLVAGVNEGNRAQTCELMHGAYRFVFITMIPIIACFAVLGDRLVALVFSEAFVEATAPAALLLWATLMGLFGDTAGHALIAWSKPMTKLACALFTLPASIPVAVALMPSCGLLGAATGTTIAFTLFGAASVLAAWKHGRVGLPVVSLARGGAAAIVTYAAGTLWTPSGWLVLVEGMALLAVYALVLTLSGELTRTDLQPVLKAFRFTRGLPAAEEDGSTRPR